MTDKERKSCIHTIELLRRLAFNVHGVMDVIDAENCDKIIKMLEQPTAQQWIPCSETVDIPEHEVICCDKYGEELIGWLSCEDGQWLCESETEMMYDPIAWREKPEPWKGEEP